MKNYNEMICLTPYKELGYGGSESIYDHIQIGHTVPEKVIAYLQVGEPLLACAGIYDHPFKEGCKLCRPHNYADGKYAWDRDTWKYVVKYGLILPQDFIDHVMSDEGTHFIEKRLKEENSWSTVIKQWKQQEGCLCLMPDNAGDIDLDKF